MTGNRPYSKCYHYPLLERSWWLLWHGVFVLFAVPFFTAPIWITVVLVQEGIIFSPLSAVLLLWSLASTLLSVVGVTTYVNGMQTICISDDYLESKLFYIWRVKVPWQNVYEIRRGRVPLLSGWVVIADTITPLHYLLGWFYGHVFKQAIVFKESICDSEALLTEIRRRSTAIIND